MLEIIIFTVGRFQVERLFRDEGGNVFILLFFGWLSRFSRHAGNTKVSKLGSTKDYLLSETAPQDNRLGEHRAK